MMKKDNDSGYLTVQNSTDAPDVGEGVNPTKPLIKSLSRKSLYEEDQTKCDDCDVYHTITGGRTHSIAATRSINPFSKITRRPLHKVLANKALHPKINDCEADLDTESVFSLGEDSWRLVRLMSCENEQIWEYYCIVQEYIIIIIIIIILLSLCPNFNTQSLLHAINSFTIGTHKISFVLTNRDKISNAF